MLHYRKLGAAKTIATLWGFIGMCETVCAFVFKCAGACALISAFSSLSFAVFSIRLVARQIPCDVLFSVLSNV